MKKNDIEKALKRHLKRKIGYTISLLVSFLISGEIILADNGTKIKIEKKELLRKIKIEKERIRKQIEENLAEIALIDKNVYELVQKADWYSKPTYESTQVLVTVIRTEAGKMKNRTNKEFKETLSAIKDESTITEGNKGIIVTDEKYVITIDAGANIKPIEIKLPSIKPEISVKQPEISVEIGDIPSAPGINVPDFKSPESQPELNIIPPGELNVAVTPPTLIGKIEIISPEIKLPEVETKEIVVSAPVIPEGFNPHQIMEPQIPEIASISKEDYKIPESVANIVQREWQISNKKAYFWNDVISWGVGDAKKQANNALISQPIMKSGKLEIIMNDYVEVDIGAYAGYKATITDYVASFADDEVDDGNNPNFIGKNNIEIAQLTQTVGKNAGSEIIRAGGTAYSSLGGDTVIKIDATARNRVNLDDRLRTIINFLPYGKANEINNIGEATEHQREHAIDLLTRYTTDHKYPLSSTKAQILALSGRIEIEGTGINIVGFQNGYNKNQEQHAIILHEGSIKIVGSSNTVFSMPQGKSGASNKTEIEIVSNTGIIGIEGDNNVVISVGRAAMTNIPVVSNFYNSGDIKIKGNNNIGYSGVAELNDGYIELENPITFNGNRNTGIILSVPRHSRLNPNSKIKIDIEDGNQNTGLYLTTVDSDPATISRIQEINTNIFNIKGGKQNKGIWLAARTINQEYKLNGLEINITDGENNYGILTREYNENTAPTASGSIYLNPNEKGINISGGNQNIGVGILSNNRVEYNGTILISGGNNGYGVYARQGFPIIKKIEIIGGSGNTAIYSGKVGSNSQKSTVEEIVVSTGAIDSIAIIGTNNSITEIKKLNIITSVEKVNAGAIYADKNSNINITGEALINIIGGMVADKTTKGFGLIAKDGGQINITGEDKNIKVVDGGSVIASFGVNSSIDAKNTTIEYKGEGYAIYSDGKGNVDISDSTVILDGKAVAFKVDKTPGVLNPIIATGTKYHVKSNDVVVFNLQNLQLPLSTDNLKVDIENLVSANGITADAGITKYKLAAVDGGTINIGNLNKANGEYFYDNFLGQRLKLKADGSTITAILTDNQASEYRNQVVGLEMSSSSLAKKNEDTTIELKNSTIIADRNGVGAGAIGAFMNYGVVAIDENSSIKVEKDLGNSANEKAVGVYAVNGSEVINDGTIEVGGKGSIGILGMAYRTGEDGDAILNEFGNSAVGQGRINIENKKYIRLDGIGSIGIYASNNNESSSKSVATISNVGAIEIGNSDDKNSSIGIYGEKVMISNTGTIMVGQKGVGIYASKGSEVTTTGKITLGQEGIGILVDKDSDITNPSTIDLEASTGTTKQIGIYYKGEEGVVATKNTGINIDISSLKEAIALYAKDITLDSTGILDIGEKGVGILADGQKATNRGRIELVGENAIGMYTKNASLENAVGATINLNGSTQIGMTAEGTTTSVRNDGTINLNGTNSIGIYLKDGATINTQLGVTFGTNSKNNIGIYTDGSNIDFGAETFTNNNENQNIYAYMTNGNITAAKITVDGIGVPTTPGDENKKTIGVYLVGNSAINGTIEVKNGAIGAYSKGNNTLALGTSATGDKTLANGEGTIGVYIAEGKSKISGEVIIENKAIGIYGDSGEIVVDQNLTLDNNAGTGMYLTNGATLTGGKIELKGTASNNPNTGIVYDKGLFTETVENKTNLDLVGNNIGIYATGGINLTNTANIDLTSGKNIAIYVGEGSTLTSTGNITAKGTDDIGIFVGEGKGINKGTVDISGATVSTGSTKGVVIGMVANNKTAGEVASIENANNIIITKDSIGMYLEGAGNNSGVNTGTISGNEGVGVFIKGASNGFDGLGGTIALEGKGTGIYLEDVIAGQIKNTGTLKIGDGGVGVYSKNSIIDFSVDTSTSAGAISVVAGGTSKITGNITAGDGSVGLYLENDQVRVEGATIETGINTKTSTSTGVYIKPTGNYVLDNVTVNAKDGVGIYLEKNTTPGSGQKTFTYSGTITTEKGTGVYVGEGNVFTTVSDSTINIKDGLGIYLGKNAEAHLGTGTTNLTFNFLTGGTAIYNDGGTLDIGSNVTINGSGSFVAIKNGTLSSAANLVVGDKSIGLSGKYDNSALGPHFIKNSGTITSHTGGMGIVTTKDKANPPLGNITIENNGTINVSSESAKNSSIGIYTDVAKVENKATINLRDKGIGIYVENSNKDILSTGSIAMSGVGITGVIAKGQIANLVVNSITSTTSNNVGLILEKIDVTGGMVSLGDISLGNESIGLLVSEGKLINPTGEIGVGNSSKTKSAIGVVAKEGANVNFNGVTSITAGIGGIGVFVENSTISDVDLNKVEVGTNGQLIYSRNSVVNNISGSIVADTKVGLYVVKGQISGVIGNVTASNGGTGLYLEGINQSGLTINNIIVQAGTAEKQSVGIYYKDIIGNIILSGINQSGEYTIGSILENTNGTIGNVNLASASNSVGVALKGASNLTAGSLTVNGNKNIGIHSLGGVSTINGDIDVLASAHSTDKSLSSIGAYTKDGTITVNGDIKAGNNSIGVYGEDVSSISISKGLTVGENGLGVYASGKVRVGTLTVGAIEVSHNIGDNSAIGVFGENIDTMVSGNLIIGNGTSIGVVSKGTGDVSTTGNMTIGESSVGVYKIGGLGDISVGSGTITVGKKGYGIYATETSGNIENNAVILQGESSIGIYSKGANTVVNRGEITVGKTYFGEDNNPGTTGDNQNSVGIFMNGGTIAFNEGVINVKEALSVGVYSSEKDNKFINNGTMNIDNGGIGVIVKGGAVAENNGTINLSGTINGAGESIGMAAYQGSEILNSSLGVIKVTEGIGMYVATGATLRNEGKIEIVNGTGIFGDGQIFNSGTVSIVSGGNGTTISGGTIASSGSIQIDKDGNVMINDKYVSIGGTLVVDGTLDINGAFVDITTGKPVFEADNITGEVNILPNFALTGNGYSYEIKDFLNVVNGNTSGGKVTPNLSPLWIADIDRDGNLIIVKKPYADITAGNQFDNLDKGLDNILMGDGSLEDKDILKDINHYLSGLSDEDYKNEAGRVLGETRGDVYSTIQTRMNTIDAAFNSSFKDLEQLYNQTKDSNKFGLVNSTGKYKDSTIGIDDYKYNITGLMYVRENEQVEYKSKFGYSLGFAVSKFDFDDSAKSKEDVYSLRAGVHRTKEISNEIEWKTQINGTFNYHETERKMNLGYGKIENKGKYQTYSIGFENRLTKGLFEDYNKNLKIYTGLNLKYGLVDSFDEKGNLKLEIKKNDYYSIKPEIGLNSEYKYYISNNKAISLFGNVGLEYELGEVYDGNKAKLKDGGEGYYSLITPEKEKGSFVFKAGTKFEKFNKFDIILESEGIIAENKDDIEMKYSIKFNYVF